MEQEIERRQHKDRTNKSTTMMKMQKRKPIDQHSNAQAFGFIKKPSSGDLHSLSLQLEILQI